VQASGQFADRGGARHVAIGMVAGRFRRRGRIPGLKFYRDLPLATHWLSLQPRWRFEEWQEDKGCRIA